MQRRLGQSVFVVVFGLFSLSLAASAQPSSPAAAPVDPMYLQAMRWRLIGPYRGGRVLAVVGHPTDPLRFYFGSTGGGVWETRDGGRSWHNISDGYFRMGSVGAIAIAASDPNVLYVGMGEACIRGNASPGDGVYKSTDGGRTWQHVGLTETRHIGAIRVHPQNPDLVYVAALGHAFGPNPERGVFRSRDGGRTWEKVLYRDEHTGAIDLAMDPTNPRILYAALWQARRFPWGIRSGGPGSGLFKSTDGGDTWEELTERPGLPARPWGRVGIAISGARPQRIWALIEARDGGLYRSDDGGATWQKINDNPEIRLRPFYYSHIVADPQDPDTVYILNVRFWKSTDGGRTFFAVPTPHGDNHALWIDPRDPQRMIEGNDGGATVTFDGGRSWSTIYNQPTAQFYHVTTDHQFPYRVYGAQQDNTTLSVPSRSDYGAITLVEMYPVGGGENGYIAVRPDNPNIIYAGNHYWLTRYDHRTRQVRDISVWPDDPYGWGARDLKFRFQWTYPVVLSPHNPHILYVAANRVFRSTDEGQSWEIISPDLTRHDPRTLEPTPGPGEPIAEPYWGPITRDNTGVEWYATIFALAESPVQPGVLWAGSDDGLVHVSRDGGKTWVNVTPKDLPEFARISIIEPSPHDPATAYIAAMRYRLDDYRPYLYKTHDFGRTWKRITRGIPAHDFTRVIREDPQRQGLLYAGTETGVYVSFDDGEHWQPLQLNLPHVPIHDLVIQDGDLVAATHGRSFWILDDLTPLRSWSPAVARTPLTFYPPRPAVRFRAQFWSARLNVAAGKNPEPGVWFWYVLNTEPRDPLELLLYDARGHLIRTFRSTASNPAQRLPARRGLNRFVWDMRYPGPPRIPGLIPRGMRFRGPLAPPGTYRAVLRMGNVAVEQTFQIVKDPRVSASQKDLDEQFQLLIQIRDTLTEIHQAVLGIRSLRHQIRDLLKRVQGRPEKTVIEANTNAILARLDRIENELIQPRATHFGAYWRYPVKLSGKLGRLAAFVAMGDGAPTRQQREIFAEHRAAAERWLQEYRSVLDTDVPALNRTIAELGLPHILPP